MSEQLWQEVASRTGKSLEDVRSKACVFNSPEEMFNWLSAQASTTDSITAQASPVAGASTVDSSTVAQNLRDIAQGTSRNIVVVNDSYVYIPD